MADAPLIRRIRPEGDVKSGRPEGEVKSGRDPLATPQSVLTFWFGCPDDPDYGQSRALWWQSDAAFDAAIRRHYLATWQAASKGRLDHWAIDAPGTLALILVLDQFSRNLQRGSARAYANDATALHWARYAVERGWDAHLPPIQRAFLYLPFEHSENLADQDDAVAMYAPYRDMPDLISFDAAARSHRDVVARFGRFPHRNALLGRVNTPEETQFLIDQPRGF